MRERDVQRRLCRVGESKGLLMWKLAAISRRGVPDLIVLGPEGSVAFVEVKAPGKRPGPLQQHILNVLNTLGFFTRVVDSHDGATAFVAEFLAIIKERRDEMDTS
jgi:hypothetical protein